MNRPIIAAVFTAVAHYAAIAAEVINLVQGSSADITLPENVTTGYSWAIDASASKNLGLVAIADHGHQRGARGPGAAGAHRWTVSALSPGKAIIVMVYRRPWEKTTGKTKIFEFLVRKR